MKIGIIGTAGRREDAQRLDSKSWDMMIMTTDSLIKRHQPTNAVDDSTTWTDHLPVSLVSGGAAWADHLAVHHFLCGTVQELHLHLPCTWDATKHRFSDTGVFDYNVNPGRTANYYHRCFHQNAGVDSLEMLHEAIMRRGVIHSFGGGFYGRNSRIANEVDIMIALTFGKGRRLKDGGTADTMKKFLLRSDKRLLSYHIDLNDFSIHQGAEV